MGKRRTKLSDQVRQAVEASGLSRYAIGKAARIDKAVMSRFMASKGHLSMPTLDALADVLNLNIIAGEAGRKARR